MATFRVRHSSYTTEIPSGSSCTITNAAYFNENRNPEDAVSDLSTVANLYARGTYVNCSIKLQNFPVVGINLNQITSMTLKVKGVSTSIGSGTGALNASASIWNNNTGTSICSVDMDDLTTPSLNNTNYESISIPDSAWSVILAGEYTIRLRSCQKAAGGNSHTYYAAAVIDIEYTQAQGSNNIEIGTSKLKDAFMGSNLIRKIYRGTELLFKHLNIPEAYQEVEYVTFHGNNSGVSSTEYINTGVVPSATKGFFLDADVTGASGCTGWGSGANSAATIFRGNSTGLRIQADNSSAAKTYSVTGRHVWTIDYYNQKMGYDDTLDSISPAQYGVLNFYLGAWYEAGTTYYGMGGNVYSFKIYDSGNLSVNYVPCYRKSDGVIGFYDTVNNVFKVNNGGGTFTKGPDV